MKVYLDTCIISGLVKHDLKPEHMLALKKVLVLSTGRKLEFVTSHVAKVEIENIPTKFRQDHLELYNAIKNVPEIRIYRTDSGLMMMGFGGGIREDALFSRLKKVLPDRGDAEHIFQAVKNKIDYFLTADDRSIVNNSKSILEICSIQVGNPSQLFNSLI